MIGLDAQIPAVPDPDDGRGDQTEAVDRKLQREHPAYSDATRYLCVGAERDQSFAIAVLGELFDRPSRAVAPSYGIDVVPIVKHCVKGQRRRAVRDATLFLLILLELFVFPVPTVLVALGLSLLFRARRKFAARQREDVLAAARSKSGPSGTSYVGSQQDDHPAAAAVRLRSEEEELDAEVAAAQRRSK